MPSLDDLMDTSFSSPPPEDPTTPPRGPYIFPPNDSYVPQSDDHNPLSSVGPSSASSFARTPALSSSNVVAFARRHSVARQLKQPQIQEVLEFIQLPLEERLVTLFVAALQSRDQQDQRVRDLSTWVPSSGTETNIQTYSKYVILSPKIKAYKSGVAERCVWTIVRNLRWDIPVAVFSNPAATAKLNERIRYHLTQHRSAIKKKIHKSLADTKEESEHIFTLAQSIVAGTSLSVTLPLCARLALLRAEYPENKGKNFYKAVDRRLEALRTKYDGRPERLTRFFKKVLTNDVAAHGHNDLDIEILAQETLPNETQNEVDRTIDNSNDAGVPLTEIQTGETGSEPNPPSSPSPAGV